jgi:hypothetical protein
MKIGITGHTSGLGKALFNYYESLGHECVGFSRSNGHDIATNFDDIISQASELDLFINNAQCMDYQAKFIQQLKSYPLDIISIGASSTVFYDEKIVTAYGWKRDYLINKKLLVDEHTKSVYNSVGSLLLLNVDMLESHPSNSPLSIRFTEIFELIDFWLKNKHLSTVNYLIRNT